MSWKDGLDEALLRFVRTQPGGEAAVKVRGLDVFRGEDCEICGSHPPVIEINWSPEDGTPCCTEWRSGLDELISRLAEET